VLSRRVVHHVTTGVRWDQVLDAAVSVIAIHVMHNERRALRASK
jgi:hypothetical protein